MRKLASIQRITAIRPIDGADKIECVSVLGWECVARKEEFHIGDLVVYIEVDSIMPVRPEFEFLRERKFRVRTIKLRKQISQGICFPLSILPSGKHKEGDDVTEIVGVTKYDPEAVKEALEEARQNSINKNRVDKFLKRYRWYRRYFTKSGKRGWPEFIKKTDEERIQNLPWICDKEQGTVFTATEKLDGQSGTYALLRLPKRWWQLKHRYEFFVCSRNVHLRTEHPCSYWEIAIKHDIRRVLEKLISDQEFVVFQGEIIGEGIQGNKYGIKGRDFYAFNLVYPFGRMEPTSAMVDLSSWGIKTVPRLEELKLPGTVKECVEIGKGKSTLANIHREGIVLRNYERGLSFKIINPDFLLKYQDEDQEWQETHFPRNEKTPCRNSSTINTEKDIA